MGRKILLIEDDSTTGSFIARGLDEHGFLVDPKEPCIAAVIDEGREFRSPFLRILAKFVRDG